MRTLLEERILLILKSNWRESKQTPYRKFDENKIHNEYWCGYFLGTMSALKMLHPIAYRNIFEEFNNWEDEQIFSSKKEVTK